jgi:hypothetical protein
VTRARFSFSSVPVKLLSSEDGRRFLAGINIYNIEICTRKGYSIYIIDHFHRIHSSSCWQTLRIIGVRISARRPRNTSSRASPCYPPTLAPLRNRASSTGRRARRSNSRTRRCCDHSNTRSGTRHRTTKDINNSRIGRMRRKVRIPKTCITLSRKRARNPRILVREIPHRDTDTICCGKACSNRVDVVCGLLREPRGRGRQRGEADVEFCVSDFYAQGCESFEVGDLG